MFSCTRLPKSFTYLFHGNGCFWLLFIILLLVPPVSMGKETPSIRIGLTPVFLDNQTAFLRKWENYIENHLHRPVEFVQRQSYREILDLLGKDRLEFAWICGYPYVRYHRQLRLLATPLYAGKPLYQSYLIISSEDTGTKSIADLKGKVFAYSDPDSNSGFLVPQVELKKLGIDPKHFFSKSFFTWSHRDVVVAVAEGLAQGGAVDGYVWDTLAKIHPSLTDRTRVITKSDYFGFPPFVANAHVPQDEFSRMQKVLLEMDRDPQGKELLDYLNIDGFTEGEERLYEGIRVLFEQYVQ